MAKLNAANAIIEENGTMTQAFRRTMIELDNNLPIVGEGSPEGVLEFPQFSLYIDEITGLEYRKIKTGISGNRKLGWELIGGGFAPSVFQALKVGTQSTSATATDLTGWASDVVSPDVSVNSSTGVFTFINSGVYLISCHVIGEDTAGNNGRCELNIKMQANSGAGFIDSPGAFDSQYAVRNNTQDQGSAQFNNYVFNASALDSIKIQVFDIGISLDVLSNAARLSILKCGQL